MNFHPFSSNDGSTKRISRIQDILSEMTVGATRVVFGWVVTKVSKESYEVGTMGRSENIFGSETIAEGIASSTNQGLDFNSLDMMAAK